MQCLELPAKLPWRCLQGARLPSLWGDSVPGTAACFASSGRPTRLRRAGRSWVHFPSALSSTQSSWAGRGKAELCPRLPPSSCSPSSAVPRGCLNHSSAASLPCKASAPYACLCPSSCLVEMMKPCTISVWHSCLLLGRIPLLHWQSCQVCGRGRARLTCSKSS